MYVLCTMQGHCSFYYLKFYFESLSKYIKIYVMKLKFVFISFSRILPLDEFFYVAKKESGRSIHSMSYSTFPLLSSTYFRWNDILGWPVVRQAISSLYHVHFRTGCHVIRYFWHVTDCFFFSACCLMNDISCFSCHHL